MTNRLAPDEAYFRTVTPLEAKSLIETRKDLLLVDVRSPEEFQGGSLPGATLIPFWDFTKGRFELPKDKPILLICAVGGRSLACGQMLAAEGVPGSLQPQGRPRRLGRATRPPAPALAGRCKEPICRVGLRRTASAAYCSYASFLRIPALHLALYAGSWAQYRRSMSLQQSAGGDVVVRGVPDRLLPGETDHLRRLVPDPAALGHGERQRPVLPNKHLDAARAAVPFGKSQELGPSSG